MMCVAGRTVGRRVCRTADDSSGYGDDRYAAIAESEWSDVSPCMSAAGRFLSSMVGSAQLAVSARVISVTWRRSEPQQPPKTLSHGSDSFICR